MQSVFATVSGLVQGVSYRASLRQQARRRGLTGWVRNRSDGRVEFHLQGDPEAVAEVIAWARAGPRHARVDDVVCQTIERDPSLADFEIR
ncbi:MAG: acylphosphatase [Myxococcales bacterium]|nr:acylphosphatase [Myxococcales bacterium]